MFETLVRLRRPLVVSLHLFLIVAANYIAFWLRFDGNIPNLQRLLPALPRGGTPPPGAPDPHAGHGH